MPLLKPSTDTDIAIYCMAVLECCHRCKIHESEPLFIDSLRHVWEDALDETYLEKAANDESVNSFFRDCGHLVYMVYPELIVAFQELLASESEKFLAHGPALRAVCTTKIGRSAYGWALPKLAKEVVEAAVKKHLHKTTVFLFEHTSKKKKTNSL